MWNPTTWAIACGCALILMIAPTLAKAAPADAMAVIDLTEAISKTMERNPGLIAFGYQIQVQEGRVEQSQLRPNPELGLIVENFLGTDDYEIADRAETTLSVAWVLERGKRQRRVDAARAGVSLAETQAEIRRLDAAAATARHFLNSLGFQAHLIQLEHAVTLAEQTVASIKQRVKAGRTPDADLARAEVALAHVRLDREDIDHALRVSNRRLAAQWGAKQADFSRVTGNVRDLPKPEAFSSLLARIDETPNITRYLNQQRLRESELRLAEAQAKPNWRLTAGVRHLKQSDDLAFVAGITIPLSLVNRNQGRIAEAQARLAMTDADRTTTRLQIETQLFAIYEELQHSVHRATTLREEIIPRIERALEETKHAYNTGRYGYPELRLVQSELLDACTTLVDTTIEAHRNVIEIERLTGTTLMSALP